MQIQFIHRNFHLNALNVKKQIDSNFAAHELPSSAIWICDFELNIVGGMTTITTCHSSLSNIHVCVRFFFFWYRKRNFVQNIYDAIRYLCLLWWVHFCHKCTQEPNQLHSEFIKVIFIRIKWGYIQLWTWRKRYLLVDDLVITFWLCSPA